MKTVISIMSSISIIVFFSLTFSCSNQNLASRLDSVKAEKVKTHHIKASWQDETVDYDKMEDNEILVVELPFVKTSKPTATIVDQILMISDCKVLSIENKGQKTFMTFQFGETERDDGWNSCTAEIKRNLPQDEDGSGIVRINFGYKIDN